ncbi:MAG: PaaI family thioesterase [Paracoccaceae bacterium]
MPILMTAGDLNAFLAREFPQAATEYHVETVAEDEVAVRLKVTDKHLRPGGTISGPSMFGLADLAMYAIVLSRIGPVALTVTTNCSIDFMRKPEAGRDLIGTARLLKLGKLLAVGDVLLRSEGAQEIVARASLTYAIPPKG